MMIDNNDSTLFSDEILSRLENYFKEQGFLMVYLFGSLVENNIGPLSDVDFAILTIDAPEHELIYTIAHDLSNILGTNRIDVVSLNHSPVEFRYKIIKQGIPLYQKSDYIRVDFEANTLSRYFDFLPILLKQRDEILMEGRHERGIQRNRKALGKTLRMLKQIRASTKTSK